MALLGALFGESEREARRRFDRQNPELSQITEQRRRLAEILAQEGIGGIPTTGEQALREAGREAMADIGGQARSQVASARGLGKLLAQQTAGAQATQAQQRLAGEISRQAAQQRTGEVQAARAGLMGLLSDEERALLMRMQAAEAGRRGGLLPGLLSAGGAALGFGLGGSPQAAGLGAQIGGGLGSAFTRI